MKINFHSTYAVIMYYPKGAGGKFLINALNLSPNCFFQDPRAIKKTLKGYFSVPARKQFLTDKWNDYFQSGSTTWHDLKMGDHCYYKFPQQSNNDSLRIEQLYGSTNSGKKISHLFKKFMPEVTASKKYFFLIAHNPVMLNSYLKFWINPTIITFINSQHILQKRYLNKLSWPVPNPYGQYALKSPNIYARRFNIIRFDAESLLTSKNFLIGFKKISARLNINFSFDTLDFISEVHNWWSTSNAWSLHKE